MQTKTGKIVITALIASLVCVATMIIKIPSGLNGYVNLGDCMVLVAGWMLSPVYAFAAAGIGSALADLFSGYVIYAPVTFVIKGVMALVACFGLSLMQKKLGRLPSQLIGGVVAEIIMIAGYYVFEGFMYGFAPSLINIPANAVQGAAGLIFGIVLIKILEKSKLTLK